MSIKVQEVELNVPPSQLRALADTLEHDNERKTLYDGLIFWVGTDVRGTELAIHLNGAVEQV